MPESMIRKFYEYLGQGKIMGVKCKRCGEYTFPPYLCCTRCRSREVEWAEMSGEGTLLFVSHNIAPPPNPRFKHIAPYAYGHIKLKEGPIFQAIVTNVKPDPGTMIEYFEKGPVNVKAEIKKFDDLNVVTFKVV